MFDATKAIVPESMKLKSMINDASSAIPKPWVYPDVYRNIATHTRNLCSATHTAMMTYDAGIREYQRKAEEAATAAVAWKAKYDKSEKKAARYKTSKEKALLKAAAAKEKLKEERALCERRIVKARKEERWNLVGKYGRRMDKVRNSLPELAEAKQHEMYLGEFAGNLGMLADLETGSTIAKEKVKVKGWAAEFEGKVVNFERVMDRLAGELVVSPVSPYVSECALEEDPVGDAASQVGVVNYNGTNHRTAALEECVITDSDSD